MYTHIGVRYLLQKQDVLTEWIFRSLWLTFNKIILICSESFQIGCSHFFGEALQHSASGIIDYDRILKSELSDIMCRSTISYTTAAQTSRDAVHRQTDHSVETLSKGMCHFFPSFVGGKHIPFHNASSSHNNSSLLIDDNMLGFVLTPLPSPPPPHTLTSESHHPPGRAFWHTHIRNNTDPFFYYIAMVFWSAPEFCCKGSLGWVLLSHRLWVAAKYALIPPSIPRISTNTFCLPVCLVLWQEPFSHVTLCPMLYATFLIYALNIWIF